MSRYKASKPQAIFAALRILNRNEPLTYKALAEELNCRVQSLYQSGAADAVRPLIEADEANQREWEVATAVVRAIDKLPDERRLTLKAIAEEMESIGYQQIQREPWRSICGKYVSADAIYVSAHKLPRSA